LARVTFSAALINVGSMALAETKLTQLNLPASELDACALSNSRLLTGLVLSEELTTLSQGLCKGSELLVTCVLPGTTRVIEEGAFSECSSLGSLDLPEGLVSLGEGCYRGCTGLRDLSVGCGITSWPFCSAACVEGVFGGTGTVTTLNLRGPAVCTNWNSQLVDALAPGATVTRDGQPLEGEGGEW
jgi:hypothetical protein